MSEYSKKDKNDRLSDEIQHGLAAMVTFLTVASGLAFVAWFHWAFVMRIAAF